MKTEGKKPRNSLMLMKTQQGENAEKNQQGFEHQRMVQKEGAKHSSTVEETLVFPLCC